MDRGALHGEGDHHGGHRTAMAEIVVPDSYSGFIRLLLYIYTGELAACQMLDATVVAHGYS